MKLSQKLTCALLASAIVISQSSMAFANPITESKIQNNSIESQNVTAAAVPSWVTWSWKILKYLGGQLNEWIYVSPVYEVNSSYIKVGSGSIDFNNGTMDGIAEHDVNVDTTNSEVDAWAERSGIDWFSKINISYYTPGSSLHSNRSVTHQQHFILYPSTTGYWKARYTTAESKRWSCWFIYDPAYTISSYATTQETLVNSETGEKITLDMYKTSDRLFVIPSKSHKNTKIKNKNITADMKTLMAETFDENINRYVSSFKNYSYGDTINFKDTIRDIKFEEELNATKLTFLGIDGENIDWYFKGDLTSQFSNGEELKLKFKVDKLYEDNNYTFETLDYFNSSTNGTYTDISNYLVKY